MEDYFTTLPLAKELETWKLSVLDTVKKTEDIFLKNSNRPETIKSLNISGLSPMEQD